MVDLQDIGARIYTYIYTMANCLRACAKHGVPVIVCDRPDPINGVDVEGAALVKGYESFVGQFPIPMRHGMTIGELARFFNQEFGIGAALDVVPMDGWRRQMFADETDFPWVMPSPNIPTLDTAVVYPGTVLFEGRCSPKAAAERGPSSSWARRASTRSLRARDEHAGPARCDLPAGGVRADVQKHARTACGGCQAHVVDRSAFRPVLTGVALIVMFRRFDPAASCGGSRLTIRAHQAPLRNPERVEHAAGTDRRRSACNGHRGDMAGRRGGVREAEGEVFCCPTRSFPRKRPRHRRLWCGG